MMMMILTGTNLKVLIPRYLHAHLFFAVGCGVHHFSTLFLYQSIVHPKVVMEAREE